jgi:transposase
MDNALFHHSERIKQMCFNTGVKLVYLLLYSPNLNPIKEFFAELKAFIKKQWHKYKDNSDLEFSVFLEWCISVAKGREHSAKAHFRHLGVTVKEF